MGEMKMVWIKSILALFLFSAATSAVFLYSGVYPMGADAPHSAATYWALETLREQSIGRASRDLPIPDLTAPGLLLAGGADYNEMCAGCHLKPGTEKSDLSVGLYPQPPNLSQADVARGRNEGDSGSSPFARRQFWIIKHGIKASGMPAWGPTHDDQRIWAMVAFLQKLPDLTAEQYQILTARKATDVGHH
jgi:mono/diheme cytochrome c family protein